MKELVQFLSQREEEGKGERNKGGAISRGRERVASKYDLPFE